MLCAAFPSVPVVALTATASKADVMSIKGSLNLKNPVEIIGNPDRPNVFYEKIVRKGTDLEFFQELLCKIASDLLKKKLDYPLTILYLPLKWCGFAFKYLDKHLGKEQYYPTDAESIPKNRLFAQFHSPQTNAMKNQILTELSASQSKLRVVFATVALGMGVAEDMLFMLGHHIQFGSIFKRQGEQVVMENSLWLFYTTTTVT